MDSFEYEDFHAYYLRVYDYMLTHIVSGFTWLLHGEFFIVLETILARLQTRKYD